MDPHNPSLSMSIDSYHFQDSPDPIDEFLSQFLRDLPDISSITTPMHTSPSTIAPEQAPSSVPSLPHQSCYWVSQDNPSVLCGAPLPPDSKEACTHYRLAHNIRGNDKETVACLWYGCRAPPMQRGSLIRHLLAVHLGLLRWQCDVCGKVFSRKGTGHVCADG